MIPCKEAGYKKSGASIRDAALDRLISVLAGTTAAGAAATAIGTAAARRAATATATNRIFGFNDKTIIGHVNFHLAGLALEFFIDEESKSTSLKHFVFIVRLIQSQSQARACSTTSREIYADGGRIFILEIAFELFLRSFGNFEH